MSIKENKEFVRKVYEEWNAVNGDVTKVRALYDKYRAPGFIFHHVSAGDMNREQAMQYMVTVVSAFPDLNFSIDDMVAEGDKVVTRYTIKGTHKGMFMGIPATGKQGAIKGVEIDKIAGGKFVEIWDFPDLLGMMTQGGVISGAAPKT
jgi:predicted ester cyclase